MDGALIEIVKAAGSAILEVYGGAFEVETKPDDSPLTEADRRAHRIIVDCLQALTPDLPVVSEESEPPPYDERRRWQRYWLVDPLDGTKEFVERNGEFTVNIALVDGAEPVLGVVGVPAQGKTYLGDRARREAWRHDEFGRTPLRTRAMRGESVAVVASRRHGAARLDQYLRALEDSFPRVERVHLGSSLKLCVLAEGGADLYPRLGPTSEWDIAAAHAVLAAAGGAVMQLDGTPMRYNKESFLNPDFLAVADPTYAWDDTLPPVP
ncbi:MAG: 3'(2'),5'-bisphosphate nucleotidase CysQ [Gammaproteobacteria bacterium]|nr:3'(2'),5'-bisphosphate nucleotidase CysQ [Gammaproteobacteria bacterium]MYF27300.1 3'(2'),5'-bisphosphate nucleotidase CysQ [Gammaproteobacteria bacterium]MYK45324.1 3'(2'),5'-bisphosphate nucleotidase CysQ [Gammaproteobacteria bacterium]